VPDEVHEAVRDLVRARDAAAQDLRHKRQQVLSFLLRHGRIFTGHRHWSRAHLRWLAGQAFNHPAQQIVFQDQVDAVADAQARLERLDRQLAELVPTWSMAPVVAACQAMRGVSFLVAVTFVAEIGDVRRFESPRQLMAFLGLVPCERSTGDTVRRGGLTLAGNRRVRRALVEGAWSYRHPARVRRTLRRCAERRLRSSYWRPDEARGTMALRPIHKDGDGSRGSAACGWRVITHAPDRGAQALMVVRMVPKTVVPDVRRAVSTTVRTAASPSAAHIAR
jgi:transposase